MTFTRENYVQSITQENYVQSIARIFDSKGNAIGTGFLVAPGYVLTCAHVVLQAIGIDKKEFASYEEVPKEFINLDFPVLANGDKIKTKVVAWLPYSVSQGDVAGLKLLQVEPSNAKPIPLIQVGWSDIENDEHSVYGFGNENGEQSNAYKLKTASAGGRFQFYKAGNPNDETIEGGFSGAPVWNEQRHCIIGMMATARITKVEQKNKAYAIPKKELDCVLKKLSVYSLCDLIENHIQQLPNNQKQKLNNAIATAFFLSDSGIVYNEKDSLQESLISLSQLGGRGWKEVDRLTQFAIFLAIMDIGSGQLYRQLKTWVEYQGINFDLWQTRAMEEKHKRNISSAYAPKHLLVEVSPVEESTQLNKARITIWPIGDRDAFDASEPLKPLVAEEIKPVDDIPVLIEDTVRNTRFAQGIIHLFLPWEWFDRDFDAYPLDEECTLGSEYKLVIRTNFNTCPIDIQYQENWEIKWNFFETKMHSAAHQTFIFVDCSEKVIRAVKPIEAAIFKNRTGKSAGQLFQRISKRTALPVALWSRRDDLSEHIDSLLSCNSFCLCEQIKEVRGAAAGDENKDLLGHHLSLVWDDPKILPPTMLLPLDSEEL